jgi:flagellar hook-basal body complex protein FliE
MIGSIQSISQDIADAAISSGADNGQSTDFSSTLKSAMDQIGQLQSGAEDKIASLLDGSGEDIHSAMIAVERANLSFEMMVQVRNKIVQAYQTISQMQF